jgi:hypothetical protein
VEQPDLVEREHDQDHEQHEDHQHAHHASGYRQPRPAAGDEIVDAF